MRLSSMRQNSGGGGGVIIWRAPYRQHGAESWSGISMVTTANRRERENGGRRRKRRAPGLATTAHELYHLK